MHIPTVLDTPEVTKHLLPVRKEKLPGAYEGLVNIEFEVSPNIIIQSYFYPAKKEGSTVIILPSPSGTAEQIEAVVSGVLQKDSNVLVAPSRNFKEDYPQLTVSEFFAEGGVIFDLAVDWLRENDFTGEIILMGQSLASVLAIEIAGKKKDVIKGLFLENVFCETLPYLNAKGVNIQGLGTEEDVSFNILEEIEAIKLPTLFFHGSKDSITPVPLAEKLQAHCGARTKQFFVIPGGSHEQLYLAGGDLYFETIKKFIDTVCGANTWRQRRKKFQKNK